MLNQELQKFLHDHGLLSRDSETHFVVAYSGGRDSTALLHALCQLRAESDHPLKVTAAYYWHPWRPLQEDLQVIHHNCKAFDVQWVMLTPNLTLPKTETAARADRYTQLARLTHDLNATAFFTAHHQDDHIETILFRLLRGTGIEGLTGIPEYRTMVVDGKHEVLIARPLINLHRQDIDAYIQEHHLTYRDDPTNTETRIKRNFLRHQLLPQIESAFPHVRQSLSRLARLTEGELDIIDVKMDEVWHDVFNATDNSLDEVKFNQLGAPFQRRVVRRFLTRSAIEAGHHKVDEVIAFIGGKNREFYAPALMSLDAHRFLSVYRGKVTIETPKQHDIEPVPVTIPGQVSHRELRTTVAITPLTPEQRMRPIDFSKIGENQAYVDLSKLQGQPLYIRARKKGDKIKPLGMDTPVKLKRFFINRRVPRFKRDTVPLLTTEDTVLWAVGVGLSEEIRVKDRPTHVITITRG